MILNIKQFIADHITGSTISLFAGIVDEAGENLINKIRGKCILIIGGAGTIGSEYIKALVEYRPKRLIVVDLNENGLAELHRDINNTFPDHTIDVRSYAIRYADPILDSILEESSVDVCAIFSAHKHVRSEKDKWSVQALWKNNVLNYKELLEILEKRSVAHVFLASSDKAVSPASIMGASKHMAERLLFREGKSYTATAARMANVAFSSGSLLDSFINRMSKDQPIAAPTDIARYFISPQESGQLALIACFLLNDNEILFPNIQHQRPAQTFKDIAVEFLEFFDKKPMDLNKWVSMDHSPDKDRFYPVLFEASDTSGEKNVEEFYTENESVRTMDSSLLKCIQVEDGMSTNEVQNMCAEFLEAFARPSTSKADLIKCMTKWIPSFHHIERGKSLDEKR